MSKYNKKYYQDHREDIIKRTKEWCKLNPERYKEEQRKWRDEKKKAWSTEYSKKNRERLIEYGKKYWEEHKDEQRARRYKRKYDLTLEQIDEMLIKQDHKCAICGKSLKETNRCVDHNHHTGEVREILCRWCNTRLSHVEDSEFLKKALDYLGRH